MTESRTEFEVRGPVGIAWIDNQPKRNALSHAVLGDLEGILDTMERDERLRFLIITSRGEHFSSGMDVGKYDPRRAGASDTAPRRPGASPFQQLLSRIEKLNKPVLAAIKGYTLGGGLELALACDMIVASETAVLGLPEARLGDVPVFAVLRLHQVLGRQRAKDLMMTCRRVPAAEAERLGLVNVVASHDSLLDTALSIAEEVAKKGPLAIEMIKAAVNRDLGGADLAYMAALRRGLVATEDIKEGMRAFFERREPNFKGR